MNRNKTISSSGIIHLIGLFLIGAALCINPLRITGGFFSDEAVYYTMAYSFAFDGDMEFQRKDLLRVYKEYPAGPTGIILKLNERDKNIVFGKSFLYSVAAAPFVRVFQTNGFLVLHAILVWLNLLCAYRFCRSFMRARIALLFACFYFLANASLVYYFWMTPEYFNMSLVCYALFFFSAEQLQSKFILFRSPFNFILSAVLFGMATYSKPPNALLIIPLGLWLLLKRGVSEKKETAVSARNRIFTAMSALAIYVFITVACFGLNVYFTGEWNYQLGKRAVFYKTYPFERPGVSEFKVFERKDPIEALVAPPFYARAFVYNWSYFFFGRFSGMAIYFFPMFFCLVYYLISKKSGLSWAIYAAGWAGLLYYMVGLPWNYFGGSGTVGNRYLLTAFAVFLFALQQEPSKRLLAAGLLGSFLFTSVILFSPVFSSHRNAVHQQFSMYRMLPVEKTLLSDLPVNAGFRARRVAFDTPAGYFVYFMDDHSFYKESFQGVNGFWVKGGKSTELVLRAFQPPATMKVRVCSIVSQNQVIVAVNGREERFFFADAGVQEREIQMPAAFPYDRDGTGATYLFDVGVASRSGSIAIVDDYPERYLGAFVRFDLPAKLE